MNKPLVSIIINNYNYERFLAQAIDSALNQTYDNVEVIVVDDGSTDGSRENIEKYVNRVIPVLKNNGGQASTFNAGFRMSKGDFVCFLDADDLLFPEAIANTIGLFNKENVVKVHWQMFVIDGNNERNGKVIPQVGTLDGNRREIVLTRGPFHDWHLNPPTSGNLWTRVFLQAVLPIPEDQFPLGADGYLHTVAPIYGHVRTSKEPQGAYRIHTNNNYFRKQLDDKTVQFYQKRFENYFAAYQKHFSKQGVQVDPESWKKENFNYLWLQRLTDARRDIERIVPAGSSVILVDNNELGQQFASSYHIIPFLEKDGHFAGAPEDDTSAITEVERQKTAGAKYLIIWWTAFWWLEHYSAFAQYLTRNYKNIITKEHLIAFSLEE